MALSPYSLRASKKLLRQFSSLVVSSLTYLSCTKENVQDEHNQRMILLRRCSVLFHDCPAYDHRQGCVSADHMTQSIRADHIPWVDSEPKVCFAGHSQSLKCVVMYLYHDELQVHSMRALDGPLALASGCADQAVFKLCTQQGERQSSGGGKLLDVTDISYISLYDGGDAVIAT